MSTSQLDLLLTSTMPACDGADGGLREEERIRWLILALAVWDTASRFVRYIASILQLATNVFSAACVADQLQAQDGGKSELALKVAARQQCVIKRCRAIRAPSESLPLTACPSQLTVREAIKHLPLERRTKVHQLQCKEAQELHILPRVSKRRVLCPRTAA